MTRFPTPRSRLLVMAILTLSLGLALTLWAQPEDDAAEPRDEAVASPAPDSLREGVRLRDADARRDLLIRLVPSTAGNYQVLELGGPESATCLAQSSGSGACQAAEAISRMPPCRAPGDCPAFEAWTKLLGLPGSQLARPEPAPAPRPAEEPE